MRSTPAASIVLAALCLGLWGCGKQDSGGGGADRDSGDGRVVAMREFRAYLDSNTREAASWASAIGAQARAGELGKAQSRYASGRVQYSQIEVIAQTFPALDARINGPAVGQQSDAGFHRVERQLFAHATTRDVSSHARRLHADLESLRRRVAESELPPALIATAAAKLADELVEEKLAGSEEPYSGIDLVDISANVEGIDAAVTAVLPLVDDADRTLRSRIDQSLEETFDVLRSYGIPAADPQTRPRGAGARFVAYGDFPADARTELLAALSSLRQEIGAAAGIVAKDGE